MPTLAERIAIQRKKELDTKTAAAAAQEARTAANQVAAEKRLRELLMEQAGIESDSPAGMVTIPRIGHSVVVTEGGTYATLEVEGFFFTLDHMFQRENYKAYLGILIRCPNGHFDPPYPQTFYQPDEFDYRLKSAADKQQELATNCQSCIKEQKLVSVSERLVNAVFCAGYIELDRFAHALINMVPEHQQQFLLALAEGVSK
jgi:hypothetical protein